MGRRKLLCHALDDKPDDTSSKDASQEGESQKQRVLLSNLVKTNSKQSQLPPGGGEEPPQESGLSLELRLLLALLVENGGVTGSVAVALGFLFNVDPFGSFSLNTSDIWTGILFVLPLVILDAAYQLPDYSSDPNEMKSTMRLLLKPEILSRLQEEQRKLRANTTGESTDPETYQSMGGGIRVSVEAIAEAYQLSSVDGQLRRLKISLDLLQQFYARNNPAFGSSLWSEGLVILLACLADEALYRAVLLTLVSLWIRDRIFESGIDMDLDFQGLDVLLTSQWVALGLGVVAGIVGFSLRALREQASIDRSRAQAQLMIEEAKKVRVPKSLPGWEKPSEQKIKKEVQSKPRLPDDLVADASASIADGMASLASTVWVFEGFREVLQVGLSGSIFIITGNLASSYVGSVLVQTLFSLYQRRNLERMLQKRRDQQLELLELRRRRAAEAAAKNEEAIKAALEDQPSQIQDKSDRDGDPNL